ncbi:flavodoxin family protein [uncultured Methanobrevibacter sp.]|uniref:flavodoxin family protein n=1 Tax=uncultured Methanobrevibacter sp. TaxID=253161 RepID=UPI0025D92B4B|nr:NAD(P)H-dependent oxidoreductase [uncultured Methanobrevibacter sp.]
MKTVAIVGSPRKEGNCDLLVKALCEKIDGDVESFFLNDLDLQFCDACLSCQEGDCIKADDIRKIIDKILEADLLILSSPIYYGHITAQLKTLIDRFYQVTRNPNKSFEGVKVIEIVTQSNPSDIYDYYIEYLNKTAIEFVGMEVIETIFARNASDKGQGIETALEEIENLEINI